MGSELFRVAIAGATSLRGKDLRECIEESSFPAGDIRLLDEEPAAGTLTDVAGEPSVIQPVDESSFEHQRFVFFTGSPQFAAQHAPAAERAGATVIDMSGGATSSLPGNAPARYWIPQLDGLLKAQGAPEPTGGRVSLCLAPSSPAISACMLAGALQLFSPVRLAMVFYQPVSERGQAGVEELELQTVKLLSLQSMPQEVFGTQVAFSMLDRWGSSLGAQLSDARTVIARETRGVLLGRAAIPAVSLVQAPVFFGQAFSAYAEFSEALDLAAVKQRLEAAGFSVQTSEEPEPTNMSVAGNSQPVIRLPEPDPNVEGGYWFWGAADNLRVASANALRIAEKLHAS